MPEKEDSFTYALKLKEIAANKLSLLNFFIKKDGLHNKILFLGL